MHRALIILLSAFALASCQTPSPVDNSMTTDQPTPSTRRTPSTMDTLIPKPVSAVGDGGTFTLPDTASIVVEPGNEEVAAIGEYLAERLRPSTGYPIKVAASSAPAGGDISLAITDNPALGEEGYELTIMGGGVRLAAAQPAGLFRGVQTLRQLLPPAVESATPQPGPWTMPTGAIRDMPRFAWRGFMLDVSRHFFGVGDVKHVIDLIAAYKLNTLHLHLSDDQGWRIEIKSWPRLATHGGDTQVGGGAGGYFTQADYAEIVAYARSRYITVVPEIDMPGHTNAALASYDDLNCDGVAPGLYTGIEVGFSSLCVGKEVTYTFIDQVIGEIAALTPGPYIHIGGDEAAATPPDEYKHFIERVQTIVEAHGKHMIGWDEIGQVDLRPGSIAQHWHEEKAALAARRGAMVIMSPGARTYLDMKYDESSRLGLSWAGFVDAERAYDWDPASQVSGISEGAILGVESALWTETIQTMADIEHMVFPRLPGHAEIGWSPAAGRGWDEYKDRLGTHGPRLKAMGVAFFQAPGIPWK